MLSVSTAAVHRAIRPKTPESSPSPPSQGRKDSRPWNCEYTVFTNRCRPSSARKKIISNDATIGIDVHCQAVHYEQAPSLIDAIFVDHDESKIPDNSSPTINEKINERPSRPIPFLKSSPMQERVKISLAHNEDTIENLEDSEEISQNFDEISKNEDKTSKLDETSSKVVKLENSEDKIGNLPLKRESKMFQAVGNLLQTREMEIHEDKNEKDITQDRMPGIPGVDLPRDEESQNLMPTIMDDNGWDSDAEFTMLRDLREPTVSIESHERNETNFLDESNQSCDDEKPYYMIGFPNPPGENRCWLNATLHALFALPLIDHIEQLSSDQLRGCCQLTRTLIALRLFWSRGNEEKQKTYQTVKLFKESLDILDESYPSQRQQDVSEFLTMFLNYIKTDFERLTARSTITIETTIEETENMTNNRQEMRGISRSPQSSNKRPPLTDISPRKRKYDKSDSTFEQSPKSRKIHLTYSVQDLMSPRVNRVTNSTDPSYKVHTPPQNRHKGIKENEENLDFCKNPIDRFFLLHMMEHYVCKGCAKHRQRKVDNLMIYVDLMVDNENEIVSLDGAIKKTREPEERTLTCGKCKYGKHKVFTTFRFCPKILMVQVNRYGMCPDGSVAKFNTPVEIPENLQMDLGISDVENGNGTTENFEPVCVIAHVGSAMDCGHYTSYVKHGDDWFHYNDLMVTPMTRHEALTAAQTTAYVIFFASTKL